MKKFLVLIIALITIGNLIYFAFIYYVPVSDGIRSGELIRLSHKGIIIKTWEGELSQGVSGSQIFKFSILDSNKEVIESMKNLQGHYVKLTYVEKYRTFVWWGETRFFITSIQKEKSPFNPK
ncbi:6-phosphogluconate dehydrogenase [Flavobacterium aestivum]|uniref:6-phosphogluconate dehydrogenase n=1 Tax=Flavobacterium aestivum TaxID=3003257 RepID=UPI0022863A6B|nr:6-phosphogluconate dehydrogenase [Flavobacterium aestivum]